DGAHRADYARRRRRGPATRRVGTHTGYESSGRSHRRRNVRRIECVAACRDCWLILWSCRAGSPATPWFYAKVGRHFLLFLAWQYAGSADPQIFLPANHANCAKGFNSRLFVCVAGTSLPEGLTDSLQIDIECRPINRRKQRQRSGISMVGKNTPSFASLSSCLIASNRVKSTQIYSPEVVCRHAETKNDDADAHRRAIRPTHRTSADVTAKERPGRHNQAVFPIHLPFDKEHRHGHRSEAARQGVLQRYDGVDVRQPNQAECANYQNANPSAKITAINCHQKQEHARGNMEREGRRRRF